MNELYVANLPADITEDQLRELFAQYGEVLEVRVGSHQRRTAQAEMVTFHDAFVTMGREKDANKAMRGLNGHAINEHRLAVSPAEARIKALTSKHRKAMEAIAAKLEESDDKPMRMLEAIVMLCGVPFAEALADEAILVHEQEGLLTAKGDRKRTLGGVFFYLARFRMNRPLRVIVYNRKGRLPSEDDQDETPQAESQTQGAGD